MKHRTLFLLLLIFTSCNSKYAEVYQVSPRTGWHKIDLGSFELEAPERYKYKQLQGIDSYVGQISDGKTTFEFDYGWYSNNKPLTPRDLFEAKKTTSYFDEISAAFKDHVDPDSLFFEIQEKLVVKDVVSKGEGLFIAELKLNDHRAQIQFEPFAADADPEYYQYEITEEADELYYKKLYFPKQLDKNGRAGVYIADLIAKKESPYGYSQLAFYTFDTNSDNRAELLDLLKTVKMKRDIEKKN